MSKYSAESYKKSFEYANKGLRAAMKSQKNFRFQLCVAVFVIFAAVILKFTRLELCITIFAIGFVLVAELFNSVIEFALDALYHNKRNTLVGLAKDMSAGAVMVATCCSVVIGIILFAQHIFDLFVLGYIWY